MTKSIEILKKILTPVNLLTILTVFAAVIVTFVVEIEGITTEKTIVILVGFIIGSMLFEKIAITEKAGQKLDLVHNSLQNLLARNEHPQDFTLIRNEDSARAMMSEISNTKILERVEILSSGLTSRQDLIPVWLNAGVSVMALVQDPETALDKGDKGKINVAVDWVFRQAPQKIDLLEMRFHHDVSTVRCVILHEKRTQVKHVFLSWYYYYKTNKKVEGSANPTLYCSTASKQGSDLYNWLDRVVKINFQESHKVDIMEMIDE